MDYVIGLDVGIGSIGWSVIRNEDVKRIEDFGVRIFDSGDAPKKNERASQKRRKYRAIRRLYRRRSHRKFRIKKHLENIGLIKESEINEYFEKCTPDIISIRVKALDNKISPEELAACLINFCNKRGYKDFYEADYEQMTAEEIKEYEEEHKAISIVENMMSDGEYRTVAEMISKNDFFSQDNSDFKKYRNNKNSEEKIMFTRNQLYDEAVKILNKQKEYYHQLNQNNIDYILNVIFKQRDFEDGPGNPDDKYRQYTGFLDSLGNCTFYKDKKRGKRFTVLADMYALTNVISQYVFINSSGEPDFDDEIANDIFYFALKNGNITKKDIKSIAKIHGYDVNTTDNDKETVAKCFKYIKTIKPVFEKYGFNWEKLVDKYDDMDSLVNKVGIILSDCITPSRREKALKEIPELNENFIKDISKLHFSGTSKVCNEFMISSINAFLDGESYGVFQSKIVKNINDEAKMNRYKTLPAFKEDYEFYNNPVVFRSINETRKIVNAIINKYGSPCAINIEVAKDLNKSLENRKKDEVRQRKNKKRKDSVRKIISGLLEIKENEVTPAQIERYRLGEEQGWKCLYSGVPILDKVECIKNTSKQYEVDHIIPFSLILDDTLANKALVIHSENQFKGQRTPLMYMSPDKAKLYKARVNTLYGRKKEFARKYKYLMLPDFNSEILDEWKSRNINDTRYIAKFLVNYFNTELQFAEPKFETSYRKKVYGVKGAITSMMRKQWLNKETWGVADKQKLKNVTNLDHAVDAIIIANCLPAYVEIVSLNKKLKDIFYSAGKTESPEYKAALENGLENLFKYYKIPRSTAEPMLRKIKTTPSLVPNLRDEVEIRLMDSDMIRYFNRDEKRTDAELAEDYKKILTDYYRDESFVNSIQQPLISRKQDRKINKKMFADKPVSIKEIDGIKYQIENKDFLKFTKKDISSVYSGDKNFINSLNEFFKDFSDETNGETVLKKKEMPYFTYNNRIVNSVKIKSQPKKYFVKQISENNYTCLDNREYYCLELYYDENKNVCTTALTYSDLVISDGKLYLSEKYKYPENYSLHYMYIYPKDYITITDKNGKLKTEGFYCGVKSINRNQIYLIHNNSVERLTPSISKNDKVSKTDIDILGKKGGVIKCGEPLLSITEKNSQ